MKKRFLLKSCIFAVAAAVTVACDDDVKIGAVDIDNLTVPDSEVVFITDAAGMRNYSNIEFRDNTTAQLIVNGSGASNATVTFSYDAAALVEYNAANGTDFKALPQSMVTFANGGAVTLASGESKAAIDYTITSDGSLDYTQTYVLPLKVQISGGAQLASNDQSKIIFIKDMTSLPDANKYVVDMLTGETMPGTKVFATLEINDTNPLCVLSYTLKNSGKPLYDAVVLFSSNINYSETTGKVYIHNNENITAVLSNYDKYIKPLKDRGMKVYLSILGNWDCAGVSYLTDETAREFAKEIKAMCDAYNLDGVFWDDEYSQISDPVPPGFVIPSDACERASRLLYEVWKVQPHRDNIAYQWAGTYRLYSVDGVTPGEYCKYAFVNYGGNGNDMLECYPGVPTSNMGIYSQEFAQGNTTSKSNMTLSRIMGWGCHMVFALNPIGKSNGGPREDWVVMLAEMSMKDMAEAFFDDELVDDGVRYPKDW